jgi:hypothetical protein
MADERVLTAAEVAEAAGSPVAATEFLAELLVSHETLRQAARELAEMLTCATAHASYCNCADLPTTLAHARALGLLEGQDGR